MTLKYFKFTQKFMDDETGELLRIFPELNSTNTYKVLATEYISGEDDGYGVTKIQNTRTTEVFDITEIERMTREERVRLAIVDKSWWCFIYTDVPSEYEKVEL